jgi:hypothetical protein
MYHGGRGEPEWSAGPVTDHVVDAYGLGHGLERLGFVAYDGFLHGQVAQCIRQLKAIIEIAKHSDGLPDEGECRLVLASPVGYEREVGQGLTQRMPGTCGAALVDDLVGQSLRPVQIAIPEGVQAEVDPAPPRGDPVTASDGQVETLLEAASGLSVTLALARGGGSLG